MDDLLTLTVEGDGENRLSHLQRIVNDQQNLINNLEKSVQVEKEKAKSYEQKIKELEEIVNGLEESNANFKQQIKSSDVAESGKNQKSNFNAKNKIKKIEMELAQTKKAMEEQTNKMKDLNEKLEEKEELIKKYTEKIELFEKDDWDRQNHWKNTEDNIDNVQELQKRCLSLENSLIELNEHCEKLRKENIEVVHLLSEEKVMRRKLLEESGSRLEYKENKSQGQGKELQNIEIEEKINSLNHLIVDLETKVEKLEVTLENQPSQKVEQSNEEEESWKIEELQQKLEWTNVVLTSKETEIFRLQNLLQDRSKMIEDMESDLNEYKTKLSEKENNIVALTDRCKAREVQLQEISSNFSKLQERADSASGKLAQKEFEHQELTASTKSMEKTLLMKEAELLEIKGKFLLIL